MKEWQEKCAYKGHYHSQRSFGVLNRNKSTGEEHRNKNGKIHGSTEQNKIDFLKK